ncbi:MAG TPA: hypothetical protein VL633_03905 [Bacteroidota bacterium]|nr:hypothetical protein [Bacteroidota bacterium]
MKPKDTNIVHAVATVVLLLLVHPGLALYGQSVPLSHPLHVSDAGGGKSASGGLTLSSSFGQPVIGITSYNQTNLEWGYIAGVRQSTGTVATLDYYSGGGWNLVSLPFLMSDLRKTTIFPTAISSAFEYTNGYQSRDTLRFGPAYWVKFSGQDTIGLSGTAVVRETLYVSQGWNMIGALSYPLTTANIIAISPVVIASPYFGYQAGGGYFAVDTLQPANGYWLKVVNSGIIILSAGPSAAPKATRTMPVKALPSAVRK